MLVPRRILPLPRLLQRCSFLHDRQGYFLFTIPEDELPAAHHAQYYAAIYDAAHAKEPTQVPVDAMAEILDSPSFSGALRSLLGPAYLVNCYGAGTPILHAPRAEADGDTNVRGIKMDRKQQDKLLNCCRRDVH